MTDSIAQANRSPNRLITEASPYLRQHAKNPVDWYPWGKEALTQAKAEDKPILLSIGYSACHWCHVMAHECFENVEIAGLMNRDFINVKVDREERPDLDDLYQKSAQVFMGRGGGWPLTMFLTPDQEPFYGGTYFPPVPRHASTSGATQRHPPDGQLIAPEGDVTNSTSVFNHHSFLETCL